jgi:hypothetical protein
LEGDSANSFFEFKLSPDQELSTKLNNIEMIVTKAYYPSGIITMTIFFQTTVYVCVLESSGENPLLDSRFPDISGKGRGYQLESFGDGTEDWPELRKVSIWQTIGALEQEFKEKTAVMAEAKRAADERAAARELSPSELLELQTANNDEKKSTQDDVTQPHGQSEFLVQSDTKHTPSEHKEVHAEQAHSQSELTIAEEKSSATSSSALQKSVAGDKGASPLISSSSTATTADNYLMRPKQALPHHLPKLDALSSKLDDIRKTMGDNGMKAPWDLKGRPLGGAGLGSLDSPNNLTKK